MDAEHDDESLEKLENDPGFNGTFSPAIVKAFRKRMQTIRAAKDERDFYALKSLHFERLEGKRSHQYSMRLNRQWRLIVELEGDAPNKTVRVKCIEDYH